MAPTSALALSLGFQAFMVGMLAALGLIATLAHRQLNDPMLKLGGLYLLSAAATAFTFSGATESLFPQLSYNWLDPISLVFGAATLGVWSRLSHTLLRDSPGALLHARVDRVVFGASDPKVGVSRWLDTLQGAKLNHSFVFEGGLLEAECRDLLQGFFKRRRQA